MSETISSATKLVFIQGKDVLVARLPIDLLVRLVLIRNRRWAMISEIELE